MSQLQPYLFFGGHCEEAVRFYEQVLSAKVEMLMKFRDSPEAPPPGLLPPGFDDKVMHASLSIRGNTLMCSDGTSESEKSSHVSLSLSCDDNAEVDELYNALSDGGRRDMPPGKTFWSPYFGMLTDRFGIGWMLGVEHGEQAPGG
jgi:PhnB protein